MSTLPADNEQTILLRAARLVDPVLGLDRAGDVLIKAGQIAAVGADLPAGPAEIFSARGLVVCPGLVDMHVHFRSPGDEHKEDIVSGSAAAAAGGFTAVVCEPNTRPPLDSGMMIKQLLQKAKLESLVRIYVKGCLTLAGRGETVVDVGEMKDWGAIALSSDGNPIEDWRVMKQALAECRKHSLLPTMHDAPGAAALARMDYCESHLFEIEYVCRDILLAGSEHAPLHISHLSVAGAVEGVWEAKRKGQAVSAEVTPHHLALSLEDAPAGDANFKMNPPLRRPMDLQALQSALCAGMIDCIATDHAPHTPPEKSVDFADAPFGVIGLETALGVVLTTLYHTEKMSLAQLIAAMSARPRALLSLPEVRLAEGFPADLTVFDPNAEWLVQPDKFYSKSRNTPFAGRLLRGRPVATIAAGRWVMREGEIVAASRGKIMN